jgi:outer membrane immunogenic protein
MRNLAIALATTALFTGTAHAEGARVEVHGGYDIADQRGGKSFDGVAYGVGIGYDYNINERAFLGVEANLDDSNSDKCFTLSGVAGVDRICTKLNREINANLRIGAQIGSGSTMIYGIFGYANLRVKTSGTRISGSPSNGFSISGNADGYRVGAGIERNFGSRAYGKIEYRYSNYEGGFSRNQGLVGVGIRF